MIRTMIATAAALTIALPAAALETLASPHSVAETMDRLVAAVEGAGAAVMARVDHTAAAEGIGLEMPAAELLIFGNPMIGTPIMQQDLNAGLVLPLRVLVSERNDGTVITWQSADEMFAGLDVDLESEPVAAMTAALEKLTSAAAE